MMKQQRRVVAAALLVLGLAAAGSYGATRVGAAGRTAPSASVGTGVPAAALPLGSYFASAAHDGDLVGQATARLIDACLQPLGFRYQTITAPPRSASDDIGWRYGPTGVAVAQAAGYLGPEPQFVRNSSLPNSVTISNQAAYEHALVGDMGTPQVVALSGPDGVPVATKTLFDGCAGVASRQLFGSDEAAAAYDAFDIWVQLKAEETLRAAVADPEIAPLVMGWSSCMRGKGYGFDSLDEPMQKDWGPNRPTKAERAAATADAQCRLALDLVPALLKVEARLQTDLVNQVPGYVQQMTAQRAKVVQDAAAVVGS